MVVFFGVFCCQVLFGAGQVSESWSSDYLHAEAMVRNHEWDKGLAILMPLLEGEPRSLKALNLAALALTGKGDILRADNYLESALRIDPEFVPALKNLAINEFNARKFVSAEQHLTRAVKLAPSDPVINLYLGEITFARRDFPGAVEALAKAGPFLFRDPNVAAHLATSYLGTDDTQDAIKLLGKLPASGLTPESQFVLGAKLAGEDLFAQAIPYLQAAQGGNPSSYEASYDLGLCYLNLKQYPLAIEAFQSAIDRGPKSAQLYDSLAEAYEGDKQTKSAVNAFRQAIALDPADESNYLDFATLCMDHQDFIAGLQVLTVGLSLHPKSDRLVFERGVLYAMQDKFELAEKDFQLSAMLSPGKNSSYAGLGVLYLEAGNAAQAVQTLEKRLHDKPDDPDLLYLLGEALLRGGAHLGDAAYAGAQTAFERSIKLNPGRCLPHVSLGRIYLEEDRVEDAVTQLELAVTADPEEKSTYWQLAVAYRKLGQTDKQKVALNTLKVLNDEERTGPRGATKALKDGAPKIKVPVVD